MNNLDEDIKIVEDARKFLAKIGLIKERDAISNLLSELEQYKEDLIEHEKTSFEFQELYIKTKLELETYKKIAEKLAELLYRGDETDYICDLILGEHCVKYETGECTECIIDWARKEVESENKNKK